MSSYRAEFQRMCKVGNRVRVHKHGLEYDGKVLIYDKSQTPPFIVMEQSDGTQVLIAESPDVVVNFNPAENTGEDEVEEQEPEQTEPVAPIETKPAAKPTPKPTTKTTKQK